MNNEALVAMPQAEQRLTLVDFLIPLAEHLRLLVAGPLLVGLVALGITYAIDPTFTARTTFIAPQQQQSAAASAIASLGALSGLAGAVGGVRTPADQYVALMQSNNVQDRIIDEFKLVEAYRAQFRVDAREALDKRVRITVGKKDGMITVEVDDKSPQRAAQIANRYIDELRRLTSGLAITEAQQRRVFFEGQLAQTKQNLARAQQTLQASGFTEGALRAEPKAAAEGYARVLAEATAAEVKLQALRRALTESAPEVQQQQALASALRARVAQIERTGGVSANADYVGAYRDFKYHEALFEMFAKQFELARVDEGREGALIQVVDPATPPERKSKPKRAMTAIAATLAAAMLLAAFVLGRHFWREGSDAPEAERKRGRLRQALRGRRAAMR